MPDPKLLQTIRVPAQFRRRELAIQYRYGAIDQEQGRPMAPKAWSRTHGYAANADAYEAGYRDAAYGRVSRREATQREVREHTSAQSWGF